ncbi:MAG: FAD-dependent oxidoreductase [Clostridia bacterium]|nr:FAD-dependent oxidoreductase [Clostridia bacterium]
MKYDIIVAGGGLSGVAAAVSASRLGCKVLIIEKSGALGGAANNCLVNPFMPYKLLKDGEMIRISNGLFGEILDRLEKSNSLHDKGIIFNEEMLKMILDDFTDEFNVDVLFHSYISEIKKENDKITEVITVGKSGKLSFEAKGFIDCTGDADLAFMANCPTRLGREDGLCQPMTLCFRLSGVDVDEAIRIRPQVNELYNKFKNEGKISNPRENVLIFANMSNGVLHLNSTRIVKKNPVNVFDLSVAEKQARKQVLELYYFLKENFEPYKNSILLSTAHEIGVRESRMIDGEYILTVQDVLNLKKFEDSIAACNYEIDIHNPEGTGTTLHYFKAGEYYTIPYRCLIPRNIDNLLVAGRCISTDHEAQASYRIMPVCCTLGEAAGTAMALALNDNTSVRNVDIKKLQDILKQYGAFLG